MACKGFNMLLQIDTFKDGIYFSPTKKVYLCSKGAQDSWALAYYYYKKKSLKSTQNYVIAIFLVRFQMEEILSSICMCNPSKSEGTICHYKIFLRNNFYIVTITRMINWLVNLPLILQSYAQA